MYYKILKMVAKFSQIFLQYSLITVNTCIVDTCKQVQTGDLSLYAYWQARTSPRNGHISFWQECGVGRNHTTQHTVSMQCRPTLKEKTRKAPKLPQKALPAGRITNLEFNEIIRLMVSQALLPGNQRRASAFRFHNCFDKRNLKILHLSGHLSAHWHWACQPDAWQTFSSKI